jgi:hypothetical protein
MRALQEFSPYEVEADKPLLVANFARNHFPSKFLKKVLKFDVRKSMHHHTIQINQPTRCNSFASLLLDVYVWLKMFRAPLRQSSGAYSCTRSLWFYRWKEAAAALLVVVWPVPARPRPTTLQPPRSNGKTRGS